MEGFADRAGAVRAGEELDLARLAAWLDGQGLRGALTALQFPSGHSNLTYLLRVGERSLVLRRPPFGSTVKSAHDMGREHRVLSRLAAVWPLAPRPVALCEDPSVLGVPFYLMERIAGIILRRQPPAGLALDGRRLGEAFIDVLADLHALDFRAAGLADLGRPEGYVERQVTGWSKRWEGARTDEVRDVETIAAWLAARIPAESGAALIHNDFKYDNCVLDLNDPHRVVGVLDWEMSTLGDPLMDLGTALGYWIQAGDSDELGGLAAGATLLPGSPTRRELADRYAARTGRDVSNLLYYYVFALFKTAVVGQQIYYRYRQGLTRDARFAEIPRWVRALAAAAVRATETGRV